MKIIFTGGGSGGHVFPIIAIARELKKLYQGNRKLEIFYVGPKDNLTASLLHQEGIESKTILAGKIRRYFGIKALFLNIIDIFKIIIGTIQAFYYLFFLAPDLIFSKGGYGSFPSVFSARILRIPIFLHESDKSPGLANRILGRFSKEIFISFPRTEYVVESKMFLIGNPIRRELLGGSKEDARDLFNLKMEKPIILILGGSQGAQRVNDLILNVLPKMLREFEVIHQVGLKNFDQVKAEADVMIEGEMRKLYHPVPFLKEIELKNAYKACDFVVSRAGSGSIFEIAAASKPSILIPLPESAQNHQVKNAYSYAEKGAAIVIEESNLTPHFFLARLRYIFSNPEELDIMRRHARLFAKPKAGKVIAGYIVEYLSQ
jgi:UDP-N-acetylglucosamine--N-acetylmuramyl-(pentapeptide) pyrophosphoryl-undecaprenol N-acetylglucosamine transferase